jgi:hypothetical protein
MNTLRRLLDAVLGRSSESSSDRRTGQDRRTGDERRSGFSEPPLGERRGDTDRRTGQDRRN